MRRQYILFIFLSLFLFSRVALADSVTLFSFTTDPQTIAPNTLSGDITIQSQSSSGVSSPIDETFDLAFTSTSATGQFLNSSGNAVSTTMSKNTSNRTFYYKDSSSGNFVLTVSATGRDTHRLFTATQHIVVGSTATNTTATSTSQVTTSGGSTSIDGTTSSAPQVIIVYSAHSDPAPLSDVSTPLSFEVSAGRDRLAVVGNNIVFKAIPAKTQNISPNNIRYQWSFGDGTIAQGDTISHAYRFAGDYVVVLNASYIDASAVSRTNVKVTNPNLSLTRVAGGIEISNNSNWEINLEGWSLESGVLAFVFPRDTLLPAGRKIVFADDVVRINSDIVTLFNPLHTEYSSIKKISEIVQNIGTTTLNSFEKTTTQIESIKQMQVENPHTRTKPFSDSVSGSKQELVAMHTSATSSQTADISTGIHCSTTKGHR